MPVFENIYIFYQSALKCSYPNITSLETLLFSNLCQENSPSTLNQIKTFTSLSFFMTYKPWIHEKFDSHNFWVRQRRSKTTSLFKDEDRLTDPQESNFPKPGARWAGSQVSQVLSSTLVSASRHLDLPNLVYLSLITPFYKSGFFHSP